jgi:hypothetical protein
MVGILLQPSVVVIIVFGDGAKVGYTPGKSEGNKERTSKGKDTSHNFGGVDNTLQFTCTSAILPAISPVQ